MRINPSDTRGAALVLTLIALAVFSALALSLLLSSATARLAAANYRDGAAALYAADAALELAARELDLVGDWNEVLNGTVRSRLTDGPPTGVRLVPGSTTIDLTLLTNRVTCGRLTPCTETLVGTSTAERPWGANNPWWRPFLYGALRTMANLPSQIPDAYVIVWIGDDAREIDGDPLVDGGAGEGQRMVRARAEAFGPGATRRAVEADLVRRCRTIDETVSCDPGIHVQSWRVRVNVVP
jgi:hypothetical protein